MKVAPFGEQLREWRTRRRMSQMDLALETDISTRHLSFIETGRSRPSPQMIERIAERLDVPHRARNALLLAAGFAPDYQERALDSAEMAGMRAIVEHVLKGHEPYPALAVDRHWNMVAANGAVALLTALASIALAQTRLIEQLREALTNRDRIGQAKGVLMARYELGPDEAFALLRQYSQDRNVKLADLADRVAAHRGFPT